MRFKAIIFPVYCFLSANIVFDNNGEKSFFSNALSSDLLSRYSAIEDSLKHKAAEYLLEGLPNQWHYDTERLEQTNEKIKRMDIEVIDADYLYENIEYAFRAWNLPWAKDISFDDFCRYILPYKMGNEAPERWRKEVWNEYSWVIENADSINDAADICRIVDASVRQWYTIHLGYNYPSDAGYMKAKEIREGSCQGASLMILYPLRALGVCAMYDYVPQWGNRSDRHSWNALYNNGSLVTFNAPETDPGKHKLEFIGVGRMLRRRPKVFRKDYLTAGSIDVTSEYLPTVDVIIKMRNRHICNTKMAVFDNANWQSVCDGSIEKNKTLFKDMAKNIVYLPIASVNSTARPLEWPMVIGKDDKLRLFRPSIFKQKVFLTAKYPEDKSNEIIIGQRYELFCWVGHWKSLGVQKAEGTTLTYHRVPKNALLWLRNLDEGKQERIFIYENGKQVWY